MTAVANTNANKIELNNQAIASLTAQLDRVKADLADELDRVLADAQRLREFNLAHREALPKTVNV